MIEASIRDAHRPAKAADDYLGPAEVVEVRADAVMVAIAGAPPVRAELAFSLPYTPAIGDSLLVITRGTRRYAIGVLRGSGRTDLSFQGDVELRAVNGRLSVTGDRGIDLRAPEIDLTTTALRMIARDVTQRFESFYKRVSSLLRVHAGESQTLVDEGSFTQAKRAAILTEETVTINGREIHLG